MKIKSILVSQPEPTTDKSPYLELARKNDLTIDFRPFIHVEGVSFREFRKMKINFLEYTAVIFTSRTAIDHFFRICEEMRTTITENMKYFCISESTALYLQKYIVYRKRKIHYADGSFDNLVNVMKKYIAEKFVVPLSEQHKSEITEKLDAEKFKYTPAILYRTVNSDLSDLREIKYDMLVFYSPSGIRSLLHNFPDFQQNDTCIATFGPATAQAVEEAGLRLDIKAPMPNAPSMTMAIENYLRKHTEVAATV